MEKIIVEEWGGLEFFFDPKEVKKAERPGEVLEALKDHKGIPPYSPVRCAIFAETPEGKKVIQEMRRICESGRDKKKIRKGIRKTSLYED